ncbi:MAG TPA: VWA domain-containing protein, partial [Thermoanaerobaculia bacterium]
MAWSCALLLAGGPLAAQERPSSSGAVTEKATVTVVEVPVSVIGKDGKPLAGLKASDFELWEDGKKKEISGFDEVKLEESSGPNRPLPASGPDVEGSNGLAQARWMILFDLSYTSLSGLLRARQAAKTFVQTAPRTDLIGVSTISSDSGWKLLVNFTADRQQAARAIDTLGMTHGAVRTQDPLDFAFLLPGPLAPSSGTAATEVSNEDQLRKDLQTLRQSSSNERAQGRATQFVSALSVVARILQSVRGRKHLLFFSEGFDGRLLSGNAGRDGAPYQEFSPSPNMDTTGEAAVNGEFWKVDSETRFGSVAARQVLSEALSKFRSTDTVIHAIDISGLRSEGDMTKQSGASGGETLFEMSNGTGGDMIRNANELSGQLQDVVARTRVFYVLAFSTKAAGKPGAFHPLKVKVNVPGVKVLARSGYYEEPPLQRLSPIERILASGDLITGGLKENRLAMRLLTASFPVDLGLAQVPVILEIPWSEAIRKSPAPVQFQIYAYAADAQGTLTDYLAQEFSVDLSKVASGASNEGIKYYGTLLLPPGDYELRVLARCVTSDESGLRVANLRVPAVPGTAAVVLPPFFQASSASWTLVKSPGRSEDAVRLAGYPFAVAKESFVPAADAVLTSGSDAQVVLMTYNFSQGPEAVPLQVQSSAVDESGRAHPVGFRLVNRS